MVHRPPPNHHQVGQTSEETVHRLTSLPPERAGPSEILALYRGQWEIENRFHYVRDFPFDGDRSHIRAGKLPTNLAGLSNAAIASSARPTSSTNPKRTATTPQGRATRHAHFASGRVGLRRSPARRRFPCAAVSSTTLAQGVAVTVCAA